MIFGRVKPLDAILATAQKKIQNSRIYQQQTRLSGEGGGTSGVSSEIDTLAKAYNNGESLGSIGATKKAQVIQRADELKREEAIQNKPATVDAVRKVVQDALANGNSEEEIITGFVEDFGFTRDAATKLVRLAMQSGTF